MMKGKWTGCLAGVLAGVALASSQALSDESSDRVRNAKLSGSLFGDAWWMARNHREDVEGLNGFWFRRVYVTLDRDLGDDFSARVRFEAASPGDFTSSGSMVPFMKDASVQWKIDGRHALVGGLSETPTFSFMEPSWGYRSVEKTPLDLYRLGSTRDFGLALKGSLDAAEKVRYHLMAGNGSGTGGETSEGKKGHLSLVLAPNQTFTLELYGDIDDRDGETDRSTAAAFALVEGGWGRLGLQAVQQHRDLSGGGDLDIQVASAFLTARLMTDAWLLLRYDRVFDPLPDGDQVPYLPLDPESRIHFVLAGVDFRISEHVSVIPNVEFLAYENPAGGYDPGEDLMARLTGSIQF